MGDLNQELEKVGSQYKHILGFVDILFHSWLVSNLFLAYDQGLETSSGSVNKFQACWMLVKIFMYKGQGIKLILFMR